MVIKEGGIDQSLYRLVLLKRRGSFSDIWLTRDEHMDFGVVFQINCGI